MSTYQQNETTHSHRWESSLELVTTKDGVVYELLSSQSCFKKFFIILCRIICHKISLSTKRRTSPRSQQKQVKIRSTMRDSPNPTNKLSAVKAGFTMRSPKLALLPANFLQPSSTSTSSILERPKRRRSVSLSSTPDTSDENVELVGDICFVLSRVNDNSARMRLQPRSLPRTTTTQLHSSFVAISNENITKTNNAFHLNIRPKELDARLVRELGLSLFLPQNARLTFLPKVGGENQDDVCLTPSSSQSLARFSSPPVLQRRSSGSNSHVLSLPIHSGLFLPDDF
jgi:hypothetical protein